MTDEKNETREPTVVQSLLAEMNIDPHEFIENRQERIVDTRETYDAFCNRWDTRIGKGKIDLFDVPQSWLRVLDEFLTYMYNKDQNVQVLQLKYKFGGIRLYISSSMPELHEEIHALGNALFDKKLIY